jgi:hypothetical protein
MTGQRIRGGKELQDLLEYDLSELRGHVLRAQGDIRRNPGACEDELSDALKRIKTMELRIAEKLAPMLQRREEREERDASTSDLGRRVAVLEAELARLASVESPNVIQLRRDKQA